MTQAVADGYTSRWFTLEELRCKCGCGAMGFQGWLLEELDALRDDLATPLPINSGYRCANHPEELKKPGGGGEHTRGAVDVRCDGALAYRLVLRAMLRGWTGIGLQQKGPTESRYVHLDRGDPRPKGPRPWIWTY